MRTPALLLVVWNGLICLVGVATIVIAIARKAFHPLNAGVPDAFALDMILLGILIMPMLLLAVSIFLTRTNVWVLLVLSVFVSVTTLYLVFATLIHIDMEIKLMEAQAQGRRLMMCGPPVLFFAVPISYVLSSIALKISGIYTGIRLYKAYSRPAVVHRNPFESEAGGFPAEPDPGASVPKE